MALDTGLIKEIGIEAASYFSQVESRRQFMENRAKEFAGMVLARSPQNTPESTPEIVEYFQPCEPKRNYYTQILNTYNIALPPAPYKILVRPIYNEFPLTRDLITAITTSHRVKIDGFDLQPIEYGTKPIMNSSMEVLDIMRSDLIQMMNYFYFNHPSRRLFIHDAGRTEEQQKIALRQVNWNIKLVKPYFESQHSLYLAIDFSTPNATFGNTVHQDSGFSATFEREWMDEYGCDFGFIEPYTTHNPHRQTVPEPWHRLYVGKVIAQAYHSLKHTGWPGDIFDFQAMYGVQ